MGRGKALCLLRYHSTCSQVCIHVHTCHTLQALLCTLTVHELLPDLVEVSFTATAAYCCFLAEWCLQSVSYCPSIHGAMGRERWTGVCKALLDVTHTATMRPSTCVSIGIKEMICPVFIERGYGVTCIWPGKSESSYRWEVCASALWQSHEEALQNVSQN